MVAGVCAGLAARLGLDPVLVRTAAFALCFVFGVGVVGYFLAWVILPLESDPPILRKVIDDRHELGNLLGVATLAFGIFIGLQALELRSIETFVVPVLVAAVGLFVVWRGASPEERGYLATLVERSPLFGMTRPRNRRATVARAVLGTGLVIIGVDVLASVVKQSGVAAREIVGTTALVTGFLIVFGSWWFRLLRDLAGERRERVRQEERADMAAHVHDSVLQTLSLIQKSATDPAKVVQLARAQERELRSWLFGGARPGPMRGSPASLAAALAELEAEIEDNHGVGVVSVVVGDCPLDDALHALLAAGREAMVNAAKWSKSEEEVSVFVEVDAAEVSMFVRDRGCGFDPEVVPPGRQGIAHSIRERMQRNGGRASIRSELGVGTEVELVMPRTRVAT